MTYAMEPCPVPDAKPGPHEGASNLAQEERDNGKQHHPRVCGEYES